jgi:hypothetical protein
LLYVTPSQPQTGMKMSGQTSGRGWQVPSVPQPIPSQYALGPQSSFERQPPIEAQMPIEATRTPAAAAEQLLS